MSSLKKRAVLVHKCRLCGEHVKNTHIPDGHAVLMFLVYGTPIPSEWFGVTPLVTELHACKNGNLGIADLIGCEFDDSVVRSDNQ